MDRLSARPASSENDLDLMRLRIVKERESLLAILPTARPRLDSLRLVASTDFLQLRR